MCFDSIFEAVKSLPSVNITKHSMTIIPLKDSIDYFAFALSILICVATLFMLYMILVNNWLRHRHFTRITGLLLSYSTLLQILQLFYYTVEIPLALNSFGGILTSLLIVFIPLFESEVFKIFSVLDPYWTVNMILRVQYAYAAIGFSFLIPAIVFNFGTMIDSSAFASNSIIINMGTSLVAVMIICGLIFDNLQIVYLSILVSRHMKHIETKLKVRWIPRFRRFIYVSAAFAVLDWIGLGVGLSAMIFPDIKSLLTLSQRILYIHCLMIGFQFRELRGIELLSLSKGKGPMKMKASVKKTKPEEIDTIPAIVGKHMGDVTKKDHEKDTIAPVGPPHADSITQIFGK